MSLFKARRNVLCYNRCVERNRKWWDWEWKRAVHTVSCTDSHQLFMDFAIGASSTVTHISATWHGLLVPLRRCASSMWRVCALPTITSTHLKPGGFRIIMLYRHLLSDTKQRRQWECLKRRHWGGGSLFVASVKTQIDGWEINNKRKAEMKVSKKRLNEKRWKKEEICLQR